MFEFQTMLQNGCDNQDYYQPSMISVDGRAFPRMGHKDTGNATRSHAGMASIRA